MKIDENAMIIDTKSELADDAMISCDISHFHEQQFFESVNFSVTTS